MDRTGQVYEGQYGEKADVWSTHGSTARDARDAREDLRGNEVGSAERMMTSRSPGGFDCDLAHWAIRFMYIIFTFKR